MDDGPETRGITLLTTRRFTLPRLRPTRNSGRHLQHHMHRTTDNARVHRTGIAAATAILALTAGATTAVVPLTDGSDTAPGSPTASQTAPTLDPARLAGLDPADPAGVAEPDATEPDATEDAAGIPATTEVAASTALQRAEQVTTESTTVSKKARKKIEQQADEVAELLTSRSGQAASRSAERHPLSASVLPDDEASEEPAEGEEPAVEEPSGRPAVPDADAETDAGTTDEADGADTSREAEAPAEPEPEADAAEITKAAEELTELVETAETPVAVKAAPPKPVKAPTKQKAESKKETTKQAPKETKKLARQAEAAAANYENGRIPADALCELSFGAGESLRCDAAAQAERLNKAYRARFGSNLSINDSYRSFSAQVSMKASKGYLAAVPGYSNHGWGLALDLGGGVESFGSAQHAWLREHGPAFGWDNPGWARADGRKPEAWHWEYKPRG